MDNITAAQSIRSLAQQYKAMVEVAEALEKLGSLERAQVEAEARLTALRESATAAKAIVEKITADGIAEEARAHHAAEKLLDDARQKAEALLSLASHDAQHTLDSALLEAASIASHSEAEIATAKAQASAMLTTLESEIVAKAAELSALTAQVEAKLTEHTTIHAAIEEAKASVRAFTGATSPAVIEDGEGASDARV